MSVRILQGTALDRLRELPDASVHCCITSPPYWGLRAYGGDVGMIGLEPTFAEHLDNLVAVFREVRRVLRDDGTLWLNYGDGYSHGGNGSRDPEKWPKQSRNDHRVEHPKTSGEFKPKDLMLMPARVAMALQADGWWLRSEIIWHKPNPMPESCTDRPTSSHEKVFLLSKRAQYFYDAEAVRVPNTPGSVKRYGKNNKRTDSHIGEAKAVDPNNRRFESPEGITGYANLRNVWTIATQAYSEAHFATFPEALVIPCIKAGCPADGVVLDPFAGSGTVGLVADKLGRDAILIEISAEYCDMARRRIQGDAPLFAEVV